MKKILVLVAALVLTAAGTSFAQTTPATAAPAPVQGQVGRMKSPEDQADHQAAKLAKELGLAPDQQTRVQQILLAERQEMQAMHEKVQAAGTRKGMGPEMKATRDKYDEQLKTAMTPDQFAKFQTLRKERMEKMREHHSEMQGKS